MPSCSGCGSGTHLDVTNSITGTAGQQTQAAWQVSDIRAEMAELRTRGIKGRRLRYPGANDRSPGGRAELDSHSCSPRRSTSPSGSESVKRALGRNRR
jgi:hypothetical protein